MAAGAACPTSVSPVPGAGRQRPARPQGAKPPAAAAAAGVATDGASCVPAGDFVAAADGVPLLHPVGVGWRQIAAVAAASSSVRRSAFELYRDPCVPPACAVCPLPGTSPGATVYTLAVAMATHGYRRNVHMCAGSRGRPRAKTDSFFRRTCVRPASQQARYLNVARAYDRDHRPVRQIGRNGGGGGGGVLASQHAKAS